MKKKYISPNMLVARLGITLPIAGSLTTNEDDEVVSATFYNENAKGDAMGRDNSIKDYNLWDNAW